MRKAVVTCGICLFYFQASAQEIKLNQLGFYPGAEKVAVVPGNVSGEFQVVNAATEDVVYTGELLPAKSWSFSDETVALADFSEMTAAGSYKVVHSDVGESYVFPISDDVHYDLARASIKALYFNRASEELTSEHAGQWSRQAGHMDDEVMVHASAATDDRPEGYTFSSPKGWYDAGDFNKYIVNSGISTYTLLAAYEHFPEFYNNLALNIPESGDDVPDLLDEARWNLDWMLTMQDPHDGGVYHKLTSLNFSGAVMPHRARSNRYVVMKSTSAALNFAAVMATAARTYSDYDPDFAEACLEAAEHAWLWAVDNPSLYYEQPANVNTGEYGDHSTNDEFDWAAAELYISTGNDEYWNARNFQGIGSGVPSWQFVRPLAWVSLSHHRNDLTGAADINLIEQQILDQGDFLKAEYESSAYGVSMGAQNHDFVWGSNGSAGNHSLMLIQAYRISGEQKYLDAALSNLDYLLGRNATGYSFVTGHGSCTPMAPHHRVSEADNIADPVPGFLVGGPHGDQQGDCSSYPSALPALSYLDDWCSYSTNEVTINWNAPLVYATGAMEYYYNSASTPLAKEPDAPVSFQLNQNYPNPFNPTTMIRYDLPEAGHVKLAVYDLMGREIETLTEGMKSVGIHEVQFNAGALSSGMYIYRLEAPGWQTSRNMMLIK